MDSSSLSLSPRRQQQQQQQQRIAIMSSSSSSNSGGGAGSGGGGGGTTTSTSAVEEDIGVLKSGVVTAGFTPIKSKKCYYAVLCERALELHESEKSQKKKRHAKHLIDLSTCFNIARHFDSRLKYCVSVMTPDETLLLRGDNEQISEEWFDVLMSAVVPARALRLGRPVLASEFFECAWDVVLVESPKLKKPVPNPEKMPNMCKKDPSLAGPQRLCFYPHTIILCKRGIEPASITELPQSGIPPFRSSDFVEFPRKFVASFGCQEKFFIMRMGRSSPSGSAEIWAQCESEELAVDIHNKLNKIIERESEKKKQMINGPMLRATTTTTGTHSHHDRIHTSSTTHRHRMGSQGNANQNELTLRERRAQLRDSKAALESFEEMMESRFVTTPPTPLFVFDSSSTQRTGRYSSPGSFSGCANIEVARRKCSANIGASFNNNNSGAVAMPMRTHSLTGTSCTSTSAPAGSLLRCAPNRTAVITEGIPLGSFHHGRRSDVDRHRISLASSSAAEETEDSGGTLHIIDPDERSISSKSANDREIAATIERMLPDELKQRCSMTRLTNESSTSARTTHSDADDHNDAGSYSAACSSSTNDENISTNLGDTSEDTSGDNMEYAKMEMNSWSSGSTSHLAVPIPFEQQYNLEEIRSYVSDSSDSCYSSLTPNGAPRTYSFGSHISQTQRHIPRRHHLQDDGGSPPHESVGSSSMQNGVHQRGAEANSSLLSSSHEDPRKRAFSLGSKSWFQKPFRKFSRDLASRTHRHSNTSAASLASSCGAPSAHALHSSTTNPVAPIQAYIAPDPYPCSRVRSESNGSGRSTPYTQRSGGAVAGDHMQLDFGGVVVPLGRSGSGSVHSTESPVRSRTSSFGCSQRFTVRDPGDVIVHAGGEINDSVEQQEQQSSSIPSFNHSHFTPIKDDKFTSSRYQQSVDGYYMSKDIGLGDDYVLGDADLHDLSFELYGGYLPMASCSSSANDSQHGPPSGANFTDSRSSQIFETIQENISGRSSRASTVSSEYGSDKRYRPSKASGDCTVENVISDEFGAKRHDDDAVRSEQPNKTDERRYDDGRNHRLNAAVATNLLEANSNRMAASKQSQQSNCVVKSTSELNTGPILHQNSSALHKLHRLKSRDDSDLKYVLLDLSTAATTTNGRAPPPHRKRSKSSSICVGVESTLEYAQLLRPLTIASSSSVSSPLSN